MPGDDVGVVDDERPCGDAERGHRERGEDGRGDCIEWPRVEPGHRIGKYQIHGKLGEGGNGAVYEARDTVLDRRVALKVLHPRFVHDAELLGRFRAEAAAMARLNDPHVVTVYDFVGDQNDWAIVMELVERGETLASLLDREGRLDPRRALSIARQIAAGLGHAHEMGIVHRDVKPANVLVIRRGDSEHAKVTDFGIARILDEERRTRGDMTLGTLYYIAPEQTQSSTVDQTADIYALGVTLYEALTGTLPFDYDSPGQMLQAHVTEAPLPPSKRMPDLPPEIDQLVLDCMAKRPAARPPSGGALAARIDGVIAALGTSGGEAIPKTRVLSADDLTPVHTALPEVGGHRPRSFAISTNPDPAKSRNVLLLVAAGVVLLLVGICLLGGLLSCVTCAR